MVTRYSKHVSTRTTPQSEPVLGKDMAQNNTGGYGFAVDCWKRLDQFLILGAEGGTYYVRERQLVEENAKAILECANTDPRRTVDRIVEVSDKGLAPKNDPAVFALAMLSGHPVAKSLALEAMPKVCRIGTHLFQFVEEAKQFRGRGRSFNRAIRNWYLSKHPRALAYQVVKYQQRNGMSHRDILRMCKAKADNSESPESALLDQVFAWVTGKKVNGEPKYPALYSEDLRGDLLHEAMYPIWAFERAKKAKSVKDIVALITKYRLVHECIPTQFLSEPAVWDALLQDMPMTAMLRNLARMTSIGLIKPMSEAAGFVCKTLANEEAIHKARIHPLKVLLAQATYASGHGDKGKLTWQPVPQITDALDAAFYRAFDNVEPTRKRWLLGIDVSGSMSGSMAGPISACMGAAAMAMVTVHTEPQYYVHGFAGGFVDLGLSKGMRLDQAVRHTQLNNFGTTDCAIPMLYAEKMQIPVDVFVVYTDGETWFGNVHPFQALLQYRRSMGIPAKLIVVGMCSNGFTIADPSDAGMLDVVGFAVDVPQVMTSFVNS